MDSMGASGSFLLDIQFQSADPLAVFRQSAKSLDEAAVAADPGRLRLFWLLRRECDDAMLQEMAAADGGMGQAEYHKWLNEIFRTGDVPGPAGDFEICNILRWGKLDLSVPLTADDRRYEITRLFGSWILLNAYAHPQHCENDQTETGDELALQNLTEICVALGADFVREAIRFVLWAHSAGAAGHDPVENLFYLLSLLVLRCASPDAEDVAAAPAVYDLMVTEERRIRSQEAVKESKDWPLGPAWLFGLYNGQNDGIVKSESVQHKWVKTAVWVLDCLAASTSGPLDPRLVEFKHRLVAPQP
ncbi:MAG: hypothetical protein NT154_23145 [Verrucomicrobia bacterium]|nr:hypothetical protein [Verrucomicrobiota bacterium]